MVNYMESPNFSESVSENPSGLPPVVVMRSEPSAAGAALVLDSERGELVKALMGFGREGIAAEKPTAALKNHSEAERRRRERINGHLATLRSLIPGTNKMDKASLLAKVISHLKELKKNIADATRGFVIPTDTNEVRVEEQHDVSRAHPFHLKASICCDYRHEILSELRQTLDTLQLEIVRAEIVCLGGRMRNVFIMAGSEMSQTQEEDPQKGLSISVHQAFQSVLDRFSTSKGLSSRELLPNKRRRISLLDCSRLQSSGGYIPESRTSMP